MLNYVKGIFEIVMDFVLVSLLIITIMLGGMVVKIATNSGKDGLFKTTYEFGIFKAERYKLTGDMKIYVCGEEI